MSISLEAFACEPLDFSKIRSETVTETGCFFSKATGSEVKYSVTFPAGYQGKQESKIPYALFLHGRGGTEKQFEQFGGKEAVDQYVGTGGTPFLVIALDEPKHSYWKNGVKDEFGTLQMITEDAISHFDKTVPGGAREAKDRAIMGISMGGHGSVFSTMKRPDLFGQLYAISPVFRAEDGLEPQDRPAFGSGSQFLANDPRSLAEDRSSKGLSPIPIDRFHVEIGNEDSFLRNNSSTHQFLKMLQEKYGSSRIEMHRSGGHDGTYWKGALGRAIQFLGEGFSDKEKQTEVFIIEDCENQFATGKEEDQKMFRFFSEYLKAATSI